MRNYVWLIFAFLFVGCGVETVIQPLPTATLSTNLLPTPTLIPTQPAPLPTAIPDDTGWQQLEAGLDKRIIRINENGTNVERLYILRVDPTLFYFDVVYAPGEPRLLGDWSAETGALITMNGGFFTEEYTATGLTIVDGVASGWSYDFGGMVVINDGAPTVRSLRQQPYNPDEMIEAGLQAFPMLVLPNDTQGVTEPDTNRARRTVIAQDKSGRILLLIATRGHFTLFGLSQYLTQSDLNLYTALNLDGGTSSGLILTTPPEEVSAFSLLPTVITVNRR